MGQTPSGRSSPGSIVTVSSAPEQQKRIEQNKRLQALSELPIFLPLFSTNTQYEFYIERHENLNPRILLSACSHLNQFLQYSVHPVVERENMLCQDIKQLEQKAAVVYHKCNARYNLLTKIVPHLKRVQEVNKELRFMGEQVNICFSLIGRVENLLKQLESIS
ncbi:hypothetical protein LOD99_14052 [Oopsacas minuta]|uniref:BLOC-1-related complex subunit 5 n=1 Tax=Oopsacas minuta TaxID=111878 RepID=A0AAV7KGJ8_9METZ|nr:hypothetical protein LOD99_14052 [Oopsacas minuta]